MITYSGSAVRIDRTLRPLVRRVSDADRYSTAVAIARRGWGGANGYTWPDVEHIILACGEDRAAADPLAAAGLSWAYDAPVFLTPSNGTPASVKNAVREIANRNGLVTVHIVGGPVSVPDARYEDLLTVISGGALTKDRLVSAGDRYDLAAEIARDMKKEAVSNPDLMLRSEVLVANGADATKFFDALALSPIAAWRGTPILLVSEDSIPWQTSQALSQWGTNRVIVGGGPATVSSGVIDQLLSSYAVERWYGSDRYSTATEIARRAIDEKSWLYATSIGCAAKLPDALSGGAYCGRYGGPLVLTQSTTLPSATSSFLEARDADNSAGCLFGGPVSASEAVREKMIDRLVVP
jgi:5'-nucleotidase